MKIFRQNNVVFEYPIIASVVNLKFKGVKSSESFRIKTTLTFEVVFNSQQNAENFKFRVFLALFKWEIVKNSVDSVLIYVSLMTIKNNEIN